jgi:hypothetical protein
VLLISGGVSKILGINQKEDSTKLLKRKQKVRAGVSLQLAKNIWFALDAQRKAFTDLLFDPSKFSDDLVDQR